MPDQIIKTEKEISTFLNNIVYNQSGYEQSLRVETRKEKGIFFTNSLKCIDNVLNIIDIGDDIFQKRILEPACGQGIFILKLIASLYLKFPYEDIISKFVSTNIYFVDIESEMIETTKLNIKKIYYFLFEKEFSGIFNGIVADFTTKKTSKATLLFENTSVDIFEKLYKTFDYVIGNPPYITLYGRRDKKKNENQRIKYLQNYQQFPSSVKNGKINIIMLFLEHSLDFLKEKGRLSFIIDIAFFESAYQYIRKYLLENSQINEIQLNIKDFDVASGQIIIKLTKTKSDGNKVKIIDNKSNITYYIPQKDWYNKNDEYKFRYNGCRIFKQILDKVQQKDDKTLLQLFPHKNLRTCVMLLDMEEKFTFLDGNKTDKSLVYPYYQGSKSLCEKYGHLDFFKYFYYNKPLQDSINAELKIELEKQGIKNKKRIGLGETIIYDNPKIYIRQSAKEIIASLDFKKSAANNSLYVFSLRENTPEAVDLLFFLCGFLNSDFITYYAQQMRIIRFAEGKQPQIKIRDLGSIFIPQNLDLQKNISDLCKNIYNDRENKLNYITEINHQIYNYYGFNEIQVKTIQQNTRSF